MKIGGLKIISEDDDLLVVSKPEGLIVNRAETTKQRTMQELLEEYFGYPSFGGPGKRAGIVHRLDKDTSGVMLVAKNDMAMEDLQAKFKARSVEKTYQALVHGYTKQEFAVGLALSRSKANRLRYAVDSEGGREAETMFRTLGSYKLNDQTAGELKKRLSKDFWTSYDRFSLVEAKPKTGRTHQIRVHLHSVFAPIVSDEIYGGRKFLRVDKKWAGRMFLHALKIRFEHPKTKKMVEYQSQLPENLSEILNMLVPVEV